VDGASVPQLSAYAALCWCCCTPSIACNACHVVSTLSGKACFDGWQTRWEHGCQTAEAGVWKMQEVVTEGKCAGTFMINERP
jgi:hypothetical protein